MVMHIPLHHQLVLIFIIPQTAANPLLVSIYHNKASSWSIFPSLLISKNLSAQGLFEGIFHLLIPQCVDQGVQNWGDCAVH